jgi:hypothetical protein
MHREASGAARDHGFLFRISLGHISSLYGDEVYDSMTKAVSSSINIEIRYDNDSSIPWRESA